MCTRTTRTSNPLGFPIEESVKSKFIPTAPRRISDNFICPRLAFGRALFPRDSGVFVSRETRQDTVVDRTVSPVSTTGCINALSLDPCDRWTRRTRTDQEQVNRSSNGGKKLFQNGRKLDNEDEVQWRRVRGERRPAGLNERFISTVDVAGNGKWSSRPTRTSEMQMNSCLHWQTPSVPCRELVTPGNRGDLAANVRLSRCSIHVLLRKVRLSRSPGAQPRPSETMEPHHGGYYATRRVAQVRIPSNNIRKLINAVN